MAARMLVVLIGCEIGGVTGSRPLRQSKRCVPLLAAYENLVGSGPTRSPRSSAAIASISLSLSRSDTASRFPRIRSGVTDLDRATVPSCKFHARRTLAALTLWRSAISTMTGNRTSTSASARWL